MNSAHIVVGKIESRTEAGAPAGLSRPVAATAEQPRILELLLRIPVGDADWPPSRQAAEECDCERGRACPFRVFCAD